MIESLDVILWDKKVGTLVANREGHRSKACFYFDSDYVRDGYDIAPLRAPVKGVAAQRGLPVYPDEERLFGGLPSFIADSLPDHWGNTVFNEWAKVHHTVFTIQFHHPLYNPVIKNIYIVQSSYNILII